MPCMRPPPPPCTQVVESVVQALIVHSALEATLAAAPAELAARLLQHMRRQLSRPQQARGAVAVLECLLNCCPPSLMAEPEVQDRLQQLRASLAEELRTQEQLMELKGIVAGVLHSV